MCVSWFCQCLKKRELGKVREFTVPVEKNSFRNFGLVWLKGRWNPNDWDSVLAWKEPTLRSRALDSSKQNWFCCDCVWALLNCGLGRCFNLRIKHTSKAQWEKLHAWPEPTEIFGQGSWRYLDFIMGQEHKAAVLQVQNLTCHLESVSMQHP